MEKIDKEIELMTIYDYHDNGINYHVVFFTNNLFAYTLENNNNKNWFVKYSPNFIDGFSFDIRDTEYTDYRIIRNSRMKLKDINGKKEIIIDILNLRKA